MEEEKFVDNSFVHPSCMLYKNKGGTLPKLGPRASLFSKLRRKVFQLIVVSYRNKEARDYFRSYGEIRNEQRRQYHDKYWYIIHPFSAFSHYWRMVMVLMWMFMIPVDLWTITFRQCMRHMQMRMSRTFQRLVLCINIVLLFDMFIRLFSGYIDRSTKKLVMTPKKILINFLINWWFIVDLYLIYLILRNILQIQSSSMIMPLVKLVRVTRLYTIFKDLELVTRSIKFSKRTHLLLSVCLFFLFCLHFNSCCICYTSQMLADSYGNTLDETWLHQYRQEYTKNKIILRCHHMYAHALMDNLMIYNLGVMSSISTTSYEEYFVWLYIIIKGYIVKGFALMIIYCLFHYHYIIEIENSVIMTKVKHYSNLNMTNELGSKVFGFIANKLGYNNIQPYLIKDLSVMLRHEMCLGLWKCEIENSLLFRRLPRSVVEKITSKVELNIFMPRQYFYRANETADCVYYLCSGKVAVFSKEWKEMYHIDGTRYFGLSALFLHESVPVRKFTAVAIEYCEVIKIKRLEILKVARKDRSFQVLLLFMARLNTTQRYQYYN